MTRIKTSLVNLGKTRVTGEEDCRRLVYIYDQKLLVLHAME